MCKPDKPKKEKEKEKANKENKTDRKKSTTDNKTHYQVRLNEKEQRCIERQKILNDGASNTDVLKFIINYVNESDIQLPLIKDFYDQQNKVPFSEFTQIYPNRIKSKRAENLWLNIQPDRVLINIMRNDINDRITNTDDMQFFPNMYTYLLDKLWLKAKSTDEEKSFLDKHMDRSWADDL